MNAKIGFKIDPGSKLGLVQVQMFLFSLNSSTSYDIVLKYFLGNGAIIFLEQK